MDANDYLLVVVPDADVRAVLPEGTTWTSALHVKGRLDEFNQLDIQCVLVDGVPVALHEDANYEMFVDAFLLEEATFWALADATVAAVDEARRAAEEAGRG